MQICEVEASSLASVADKSENEGVADDSGVGGSENSVRAAGQERGSVLVMLCPAHSHCVRPKYDAGGDTAGEMVSGDPRQGPPLASLNSTAAEESKKRKKK